MARWRTFGAALAAAALPLTMGGCDGNTVTEVCPAGTTGSPPNCQPTPPPCTQSQVLQDSGGIPAQSVVFEDFSVPDSGRLDVILDWTVASNPVGFYLVPANTCTTVEEFNARSCNFLVRAEPSATKPRKISTPNFAAGNYRWMIANYASQQESVSLQIVLQKGAGCAPLTGGSPAAASSREGELPPIERIQHR
jgi:hypothetical protein